MISFFDISRLCICISLLSLTPIILKAQAPQPYQPLQGGSYRGTAPSASPDPLVNYYWQPQALNNTLQYMVARATDISWQGHNAQLLPDGDILVSGDCDLQFDFGREYAAWPEFDCDELSATIQMSISEYNEPAILNEGAQHPVKTATPVRYGTTYRLELNTQLYEGVRFSWIHVRNVKKPFRIKQPRLICQVMPVNYQGAFETNDQELNRLWYTGAYTVRLNLLPEFFGAILMERSDRHSWTGDAYPSQAASLTAFGNYNAVQRNIEYTSRLDNGIASYAIYWVLSLVDYFHYTGDTGFVRRMLPVAHQHLQNAFQHFDQLPNLVFSGWDERLGAGFERPNLEECKSAYRLLCLNAWRQTAEVARMLGDDIKAQLYQHYYQNKSEAMVDPAAATRYGIHSIANAINAGLLSSPSISGRADQLLTDRSTRLSYSPFNQHFILQAMAVAGRFNEALVTARDQWGGQLAYGGTSFFEVYRPSWNQVLGKNDAPPNNQCGYTSLAHPWGAGITQWLSENILGIRPVEPGFSAFSFMPYTNEHISRVKGAVPTPHGILEAAFDTEAGTALLTIPENTRLQQAGFPLEGRSISKIRFRKNGSGWKRVAPFQTDSLHCWVKNLTAGRYEFRISFVGKRNTKKTITHTDHSASKASIIGIDSLTQENWQSRYGRDGYLFAGKPGRKELLKQPAYIDSIRLNLNDLVVWDSTRAAFITRDPLATLQTMTMDIHCNQQKPYEMSLYLLDWDDKNRRSAIEVFDLETLEIITPVQLVSDYQKGKYWRACFQGSVRIRINHVRGSNASVSAVLFDPVKE